MRWRSSETVSRTKGLCPFTATSSQPSLSRALYSGPSEAAATGSTSATEELAALEETAATCELVAGSRAVYDSIDGQINVTVVSVLRDSNGVVYTLLLPDGTNARVDKRNVLRAVRVESGRRQRPRGCSRRRVRGK